MTLCMPNSNCCVCTKYNILFSFFTVNNVEFLPNVKSVNDSNGTNITYDKYFSSFRLSKTTSEMICCLICQTVRTYGYKSNAKCLILFLQLFTVIPTKKFHPFKIKFAIEFPL